jgi:cardiolipin synthase
MSTPTRGLSGFWPRGWRGPRPSRRYGHGLYVSQPERLCGGNRVELLVGGGATYESMLAAIASAQHSVLLVTYILHGDATGRRFREALIERARAGVDVRLMYDAVGSYGAVDEEFLLPLAEAGVAVHIYFPILPARRELQEKLREVYDTFQSKRGRPAPTRSRFAPDLWGFHRRNHQKILTVDERIGFTGGINIGDDYADREEHGERVRGWHDLHVRVEGPAAVELANAFRIAWNRSGGATLETRRTPLCRVEPVQVEVLANLGLDGLRERLRGRGSPWMWNVYRTAIRAARERIVIANAYFLPDRGIRKALKEQARRGLRVQVIVPRDSDVRLVKQASHSYYTELLDAGIEIHEYRQGMMHAKATVIDGEWATVGSYNLDHRSFRHNLEAGVAALDRDFARSVLAQLDRDIEACERVDPALWRRRPWRKRLREWLARNFVYWL